MAVDKVGMADMTALEGFIRIEVDPWLLMKYCRNSRHDSLRRLC